MLKCRKCGNTKYFLAKSNASLSLRMDGEMNFVEKGLSGNVDVQIPDKPDYVICERCGFTQVGEDKWVTNGPVLESWLLKRIRKAMPSASEERVTLVIGKDGFISVRNTGKRYDYSFYGMDLSEIDNGHLYETAITMEEAIEMILRDSEFVSEQPLPDLFAVDSDCFEALVKGEYDILKDHLFMRVSSKEKLSDVLCYLPHVSMEDLTITFHILLGRGSTASVSICVNFKLMKSCGVYMQQLYEDAQKNAPKIVPVKIENLETMLSKRDDGIPGTEGVPAQDILPIIVVTNEEAYFGSAAFFYPGVMDQIGHMLKGDYYILPSSLHEMLAVPDCLRDSYMELKELVRNINDSSVQPKDRLTDNVYHYDVADHIFETAESFEKRKRAKYNSLMFSALSPV